MTLAATEPGGTGVISVEDWAEIRRLHRAEGMPIKAITTPTGLRIIERSIASASTRYSHA